MFDDFCGLEGCNEIFNEICFDVLEIIYCNYFEVGVDVVEMNMFGCNLFNFGDYDIVDRICDLLQKGIVIVCWVVDELGSFDCKCYVLGLMVLGIKLLILGYIEYVVICDVYIEVVLGMLDGGVDVILVEICQDLLQLKVVVLGLWWVMMWVGWYILVFVYVIVEIIGIMLLGSEIGVVLIVVELFGVDMIGLNCVMGLVEMSEYLCYLFWYVCILVLVMFNVGLLVLGVKGVEYLLLFDELVEVLVGFIVEFGFLLVGGCCGIILVYICEVVVVVVNIKCFE